jgi:hypothetical protein
MQNLGNVYICGSPFDFVMSRTDAQNGLDMVFNINNKQNYESQLVL